jgi:RNA polymerase sigma factor (sigma-70 family)
VLAARVPSDGEALPPPATTTAQAVTAPSRSSLGSIVNQNDLLGKYVVVADSGLADGNLIARSVAEPQLFTAIFDRHYRSVYGYLSWRVGRTVADDLAAETFIRAFERRTSYNPAHERALPWLLGIAVNLLAHHRRSEVRQLRALAAARRLEPALPEDAAVPPGVGVSERLVAGLEQLDDYDREVLLLYAWGELKYEEIAGVLGIPIGTVRSRLNRARGKLRQALEFEENVVQLRPAGSQDG